VKEFRPTNNTDHPFQPFLVCCSAQNLVYDFHNQHLTDTGNPMIEIDGKNYKTETVLGFDNFDGHEAKIVTGVNTPSGQAVAIQVNGTWQFINPSVR